MFSGNLKWQASFGARGLPALGLRHPSAFPVYQIYQDELAACEDPKWLYVVGRVNSGKSTFVNRFLWYIGYRCLTHM